MEKFTKGPWTGFNNGKWADCGSWSVNNDDASSYSNVAVNLGDVTICLVVSDSWDDCEMEANAHLIAAAPEMYNMLQSIIDPYVNVDSVICRIADLLEKARGEQ